MNTHTRRSVTTTALVAASTGLFAIAAPAASAATSSTSSISALAVVDTTAPAITSVVAHPTALSVTWTAPTTGGTVRGYVVMATSGSTVKGSAIVPGDALEATVGGLANGTTYQVTVLPFTDAGAGGVSPAVAGQPTAEAPVPAISEAVRNLAADKGLGFVTVTWAAPVNDNGATIQAYSVIAVDRAGSALGAWRNVRPDVRSASLTGLKGGHTYDLYVLPVTAAGFGKVAPAVALTPSATSVVLPKTPAVPAWSVGAPSGDTAVVSWGPAPEQGEAVTGYNVVVIQHNDMTAWKVTGPDARQVTVPLDENGTASVYVVAQSASGFGALPETPIPVVHG